MYGVFNREESWEKQSVFDLENGWKATVEYNSHYGQFISRLEKDGICWHCSNGINEFLPDFAHDWLSTVHKLSNTKLVLVGFRRLWTQN